MSYLCEYCNHSYTTKNHLTRHQNTEKCQYIKRLLDKRDQLNNEKNNTIQKENELLKKENELLKIEDKENKTKIKILQDKYEDLRKIVEKAAIKSTTTVKKTYNHNNYLNYISSEPLKISELPKQLKYIVNCDTVMYDDDDFHDHIVDNILKDKDGKDKVLCTDINRKNFTYKDEKSGELISDPELERLREQLKKGTDIRQIRHELLEKLVSEYEENGCVGIDPYKRFYEIVQKLKFGSPFVDHVARKTYVKTKNAIEDTDNTENNYSNQLEYTEEEYKELCKEFGNQ
uniref:C2H2-type domain-containing protein n=1 Tax=viral metagenome TaxID=1070528 RepID=A0A6C0I5A6_9ZZZZ